MKQTLQIKMGQRLSMTPQLQQAIRLLQMSALDLVTEVRTQIETNPMLEEDESAITETVDPETELSGVDRVEPNTNDLDKPEDVVAADDGLRAAEVGGDKLLDSDFDAQFDPAAAPVSNTTSTTSNDNDSGYQNLIERGQSHTSLRQSLTTQLATIKLSMRDNTIALHIIDAIDDRGYLCASIDDVSQIASRDIEDQHNRLANANTDTEITEYKNEETLSVDTAETEAVLKLIQNLEPDGVGARNLQECLLIQLRHSRRTNHTIELAYQLVEHNLDAVAARNYKRMAADHQVDVSDVEAAMQIIIGLTPYPGDSYGETDSQYIVPDIVVRQHKGKWRAQLNSQVIPRVRLNRTYASLQSNPNDSGREETSRFIKEHAVEAKWFIKALNNRHETLLRVAREIVEQQDDYFNQGEAAMKPMILSDVAAALDLHESTVSRATTQKYMQTPLGVFELKYFFSSALTGRDGESHSSTAIRSYIRKIVDDELATKPMSDNKIASLLSDRGISVARRTVAKYRESMNIPSSSQRKRVG